MPWGGSGWSRSSPCDLVRLSGAWLSPSWDAGTPRLACPQSGVLAAPPHTPLTLEDSFRLLQCLLQPFLWDSPQPDLGILTRYGTKMDGH